MRKEPGKILFNVCSLFHRGMEQAYASGIYAALRNRKAEILTEK
jgi:hypothetical protein